MIEVTESAQEKMKEVLDANGKPYIRFGVKGGGCAGFNYQIDVEDTKKESDQELAFGDVRVLVADVCEMFVLGTRIDYKKEIFGSYFTYDNPNAHSSCGCGTSFSVK
jgi:iron-sulfur cluster assembly protein